MNAILSVSIALLAGLLMTRLFKIFKLPSVTSYLIAGVLIGPYCLGALGIAGFGFHSASEVESLIAQREKYPQLNFIGVQYFTGTQKKLKKTLEELDFITNYVKKLE